MKKGYISIILTFITLILQAQDINSDIQNLLEKGKILLDSGYREKAKDYFLKSIIISKSPKYREGNPEVFIAIGDIYMNTPSQDKCKLCNAYDCYIRARDIEPRNKKAWERLKDERLKPIIISSNNEFCTTCYRL